MAPISTDNYLGSVILLPSISIAPIWIASVWDDMLYGRVSSYCHDKGINLLIYVFSDIYSCEITCKLKNQLIVKLGTKLLIASEGS